MRIEDTYKTPIHGVSTLAPRNRADGQAELQVNLRSDPVRKLTRRPPLEFKAALYGNNNSELTYHEYRRDGNTYRVIVDTLSGSVAFFKNETLIVKDTAESSYYVGGNVIMKTIEDTTYLLNKDVVVGRGTDTDTINRYTHINVISALNYGETVTVGIGSVSQSPLQEVSYVVPDLGPTPDYDTADKARATNAVAAGLQVALMSESWFSSNYTAIVLGSTVAIAARSDSPYADTWVNAYVVTGQGDRSVVVINSIIENVTGLPLYAVHGTRITVKPDPVRKDGTYYLQAESIVGNIGGILQLEECVWSETRVYDEPNDIDASTLPLTITYDDDAGVCTVAKGDWKTRRTGDDETCPPPEFIGSKILDLGHFQNRLVFIANGQVFMTETDDYLNWWKASALKLLVTDPIAIGSSAVDTDDIERVSSHNRDMLLVSPNGQFKIDGNIAVTPQSVSMPKVSSFECQTSVAPVPMGTNVMLAIQQGQSGGVLSYTTKKATEQERGDNVSKHVVGLMQGTVTKMVGSVNSDILVMMSSEGGSNKLYVYETYDDRGKVLQNSWSEWELPTGIQIIDLSFRDSILTVVTNQGGYVCLFEIDLYNRLTREDEEVFLDYRVLLDSPDGATVELPANYPFNTDSISVRGDGCEFKNFPAQYTRVGATLTFKENLSNGQPCKVYLGVPTTVRFMPTRPFKRNESGQVVTNNKIRVARWHLSVVDTHEVTMRIHSEFVNLDDQTFEGRVMGQNNNLIGEKKAYTGDLSFSYSQDASLANVEFRTDGYLEFTISSISWDGQYYKTGGRL